MSANLTLRDGNRALRLELHYQSDEDPGFLRLIFAEDKSGVFDFEGGLCCDLGFDAVSQMLQVFRGETESVNEGKPIDLGDGKFFAMKHIIEGGPGFAVACLEKSDGGQRQMKFLIRSHEACGIESVISGSMFFLAFVKGVNT